MSKLFLLILQINTFVCLQSVFLKIDIKSTTISFYMKRCKHTYVQIFAYDIQALKSQIYNHILQGMRVWRYLIRSTQWPHWKHEFATWNFVYIYFYSMYLNNVDNETYFNRDMYAINTYHASSIYEKKNRGLLC